MTTTPGLSQNHCLFYFVTGWGMATLSGQLRRHGLIQSGKRLVVNVTSVNLVCSDSREPLFSLSLNWPASAVYRNVHHSIGYTYNFIFFLICLGSSHQLSNPAVATKGRLNLFPLFPKCLVCIHKYIIKAC